MDKNIFAKMEKQFTSPPYNLTVIIQKTRFPSAEKGQNLWFSLQKKQKYRAPIFGEQANFRAYHYS
jgi:hypothetical protein